ncbi:hypothetical protein, partial [Aeromonas veronii]
MPSSPQHIASEIDEIMRRNGNEAITLKWEQFYTICDREKLAEVILEKVSMQLKKRDIHIVYAGSNVIVVHVQDLKRRVHLKRLPRSCSVSTFSA